MQRLALRLSQLSGWRRFAVSMFAGAVSVLAMAPFHAWPVLFATFPVLVWLLDGACVPPEPGRKYRWPSVHTAASIGWAFGFGYFLAGLYWICHAFLVEAEIFAWLLPFAVTLMPAGLALFFALAASAACLFWRPGPARIIALALAFTAAEWLRGTILTGFPWNTLGYALTSGEALMQWASVFGIYGLTLIAVLIFASPAVVWVTRAFRSSSAAVRFGWPLGAAVVLSSAFLWGAWRLENAPARFVENVRLRILQPSIPQSEKWKPENRAAVFQRYLQVSQEEAPGETLDNVSHLIWPESALPFLLEETPEALAAIANMLPEGTVFITGAARAQRVSKNENGRKTTELNVYNSLFVMDHEARTLSYYDKVHLVPFGEYLPLQATLEAIGLEQLTRIRGGFTPGNGSRQMKAPGVPGFVGLICYEIIFPDAIREQGTPPGWMLNVTNDAWFGNGTGPYQHFHQARIRAVEQGLPLVRAANNGISAVTDPYGRIVARLPRNAVQSLDANLPVALEGTVFVRIGVTIVTIMILLSCAGWWAFGIRTDHTGKRTGGKH
jgi:apolipoprotein N-acyltransferase